MVSRNSQPTRIFKTKVTFWNISAASAISFRSSTLQLEVSWRVTQVLIICRGKWMCLVARTLQALGHTMIQYNTKVQNMLRGFKSQACQCSPKHEGESRELDWPANDRIVTSCRHWVGVSTGLLMQNSARGQRWSGISSFHFTTKTTKPPSISCSISYQLPIFYSTAWSQLTGNSSSHHLPRKMNVSCCTHIASLGPYHDSIQHQSAEHAPGIQVASMQM